MELDRPLTSDETRRLAETWKKRYSVDNSLERNVPEGNHEAVLETANEGDLFPFLYGGIINRMGISSVRKERV